MGLKYNKLKGASVKYMTAPGEAVQDAESGAWYYVLNREGVLRQIGELTYPDHTFTPTKFDTSGIFDRIQNPQFHNVYTAAEGALPLVFNPD